MQVTSDVRKALGEKAKAEREKAQAKEEAERRALLEVSQCSIGIQAEAVLHPSKCQS